MLRAFLVPAVFLCGVLLGRDAERRLRQRRDLLAELIAAVKRLLMHMEYERRPLACMAAACAGGAAAPVFGAFGAALEKGEPPAAAWAQAEEWALLRGGAFAALHPGDRAVLRAFMESLGAAGMEGEKRNAELALAQLERRREEADAAYGSRGRVCRAMGALCGAAVALLLL